MIGGGCSYCWECHDGECEESRQAVREFEANTPLCIRCGKNPQPSMYANVCKRCSLVIAVEAAQANLNSVSALASDRLHIALYYLAEFDRDHGDVG